jgi:hypothetical protein
MRSEAGQYIMGYLAQHGSARGPIKIEKEAGNQPLPGLSLPGWMMQVLNIIAGHPALPYGHDRAAAVRDMLYLSLAAYAEVLSRYETNDPDVDFATHIIRQEQAMRRDLYVEETLLHFVEDLAVVAVVLELKIKSGSRQVVFEELESIFHHIENLSDTKFWRPTIMRMALNVPEIRAAMQFVWEGETFHHHPKVSAWMQLLEDHDE